MWRRLFHRQADANLDDELNVHIEIETKRLMERGLSRGEAELEARRMFGNRTLVAEVTRETRAFSSLAFVWHDVRHGARNLRRSPGFTLAAVLSLALGIGATTAVFSIADAIFLRPLPYSDPGQLVWVAIRFPSFGEFLPSPDFVAWRRDNHVFDQLAATQANGPGPALLGASNPIQIQAARVSSNFLPALRIEPALGRNFNPDEELPNGPKAVLLTDKLWRERFESRREIVGSVIPLDGQPHTIAGVLPASFVFPMDAKVDCLTTLPVSPTASHHDRDMSTWAAFGRLKAGVTIAQAKSDLETLFAVSKADLPIMFRSDTYVNVEALQEHRAGNARTLLLVLIGSVSCLLLVGCANVANLLLARWSERSREFAVRAAIGAGRARLVRQLFIEASLLAAAGWVVSLVFVSAALRAFVHFAAAELPRLNEINPDARVFGIALAISLITTLAFGGVPALRAGSTDIQSILQKLGRVGSASGSRVLRRALVVTEIALSAVLLCGAALLLQTLWHMRFDHLGFRPDHVLTISIPLKGPQLQSIQAGPLGAELLDSLRRLPGTETASLTQCTPLSSGISFQTFLRSDRPRPEAFHRGDGIGACGVDADYFMAAGSRLLLGRFISADDSLHPGTIAVINEAAMRAFFPGENPLGKLIQGGDGHWKTVVGVVADAKNRGLNKPALPQMFMNDTQTNVSRLLFMIRTRGGERVVATNFRDELRGHHPELFASIQTLDQAMDEMTASPRFNSGLLSGFAGIAFLTAMIGIYGVIAFSVTQRTREIGIRMALGARPAGILGLVMREGLLLIAIGTVAGLCLALALTRYLEALLYEVKSSDPGTYAMVIAALVLAAMAASCLPARRAASVDPMVALRHE